MKHSQKTHPDSVLAIADKINTWQPWSGFSGEVCSCGATYNAYGMNPGYHCPSCDDYNCQSWSMNRPIHDEPDYGPTFETIREGGKIAHWLTEQGRKFKFDDPVWADRFNWPRNKHENKIEAGWVSHFGEAYNPRLIWYFISFLDGSVQMILEESILPRPRGETFSFPPDTQWYPFERMLKEREERRQNVLGMVESICLRELPDACSH